MSRNALKGRTRIRTLSMILLLSHIKDRGYSTAYFKPRPCLPFWLGFVAFFARLIWKGHIFFVTIRNLAYEQSIRSLRAQLSWFIRKFAGLSMCSSSWGFCMFFMIVSLHQINYGGCIFIRIKEDISGRWDSSLTSSFMRGAKCHGTIYSIILYV